MKYEVTDLELVDDDIIIATIKFDGSFEITKSFGTMLEAAPQMLEALKGIADIANDAGECCHRCEGNGRLWADGQAHYPSYNGPTIACPQCGGVGRFPEVSMGDIASAATDAIRKAEGRSS